jgi:hypothetical protein
MPNSLRHVPLAFGPYMLYRGCVAATTPAADGTILTDGKVTAEWAFEPHDVNFSAIWD